MVFLLLLTVGFIVELASCALDFAKHSSSTSPNKNTPLGSKFKVSARRRFYSTSSSSDDISELTLDRKRKRDKGNPKYTFQYRINQTLTPFQAEVLIGLLLGDGCIQAPVSKIGGHRLTIRHSMNQYDYLLHLRDLFEAFVVQPLYISSSFDKLQVKLTTGVIYILFLLNALHIIVHYSIVKQG